ncbi:hypothetical protein [Streptomyces sp. KLOTTS4A1]|uniref:hypothetical protein n=1 Tax=Streptomyces sp. KLOTTS4A1 TaxID=3390996 RepID=UPI0039F477B8
MGLVVPLIDRGAWLWVAAGAWFLFTFKTGLGNVLGVSLRQRLTPARLLGRMNATFRFMFTGSMALAAAASGLIAEYASLRVAVWTGGICLCLSFLPVYLSPIRARPHLPDAHDAREDYDSERSQPGRSARAPS